MAIVVAVAVCTLVGLIILALLRQCGKHKVANNVLSTSPSGLHEAHDGSTGKREAGDTELFVQYDFNTLKIATGDFADENMLGEGGFGNVYRGTLTNGQYLAIKRLSGLTAAQGTQEFKTEARLLAKLQHKNLVKLVGFCSEGDETLLVYEYMSKSNLDRVMFYPSTKPLLNWGTRYHIIIGIARGLQYLHEYSPVTIVHRNLKLGNILLDKRMNPKIADFGIARLFEAGDKSSNAVCIVETQGYMAPEYLMTGDYSDKSDVYSFGIMILEIVISCDQKNRISKKSRQKEDLPMQVWRLWDKARSFNLANPVLINNYSIHVFRCTQIGLLCVQVNAEQRPTMTAVVRMLTSSIDLPLPPTPQMSMAYSGAQQSDPDCSSSDSTTMRNDMDQDIYPKPR